MRISGRVDEREQVGRTGEREHLGRVGRENRWILAVHNPFCILTNSDKNKNKKK